MGIGCACQPQKFQDQPIADKHGAELKDPLGHASGLMGKITQQSPSETLASINHCFELRSRQNTNLQFRCGDDACGPRGSIDGGHLAEDIARPDVAIRNHFAFAGENRRPRAPVEEKEHLGIFILLCQHDLVATAPPGG
nr:hypothetical protein [Tateyamaria pelophila]